LDPDPQHWKILVETTYLVCGRDVRSLFKCVLAVVLLGNLVLDLLIGPHGPLGGLCGPGDLHWIYIPLPVPRDLDGRAENKNI